MTITRTRRFASVAVLAIAGFSLVGCGNRSGGDASPPPAPKPPSPLASFDPCSVLSPGGLEEYGAPSPGKPVDQGIGEPGCRFSTDKADIEIHKNVDTSIGGWQEKRSNFDLFEPNKVGERRGIKGIPAGGAGQEICDQFIDSGGGSIDVRMVLGAGQGSDPCAEAMKIAQQVEPKLPK